jgi:presequence protease
MRWEKPLAHFKERLAAGEDVFGDLLDRFLLNNKHRVTVVTLPDSSLAKKVEEKEAARLKEARSAMSEAEVEAVVRETQVRCQVTLYNSSLLFGRFWYRAQEAASEDLG